MKKILFVNLLLLFVVAGQLVAQDLISVADLKKNLTNKDLVIIDARKDAEYKEMHIKGAINIYHGSLCNDAPIKSIIKSSADMAAMFGKAGVSEKSMIVVYDDGSGKYAGRLYWILKYLGATNVKMLDGNMKAWKAGRASITATASTLKATTFTPTVNKKFLANMDEVKAAQNNSKAVIVDVRPVAEYNGSEGTSNRLGHIPHAINFDFTQLLKTDGTMKSKEDMLSLLKAAGITSDKEVIAYCTSSVRAGILFLALHSVLGYTNVKVYDGALYEWESIATNQVVK